MRQLTIHRRLAFLAGLTFFLMAIQPLVALSMPLSPSPYSSEQPPVPAPVLDQTYRYFVGTWYHRSETLVILPSGIAVLDSEGTTEATRFVEVIQFGDQPQLRYGQNSANGHVLWSTLSGDVGTWVWIRPEYNAAITVPGSSTGYDVGTAGFGWDVGNGDLSPVPFCGGPGGWRLSDEDAARICSTTRH